MRYEQIVTLLIAAAASAPASAGTIYQVTMDTSALLGQGTFYVDFQFNDGSGAPPGLNNNQVTVSAFNFGTGGTAGSPLTPIGGASGDMGSSVTLVDSQFFNEFTQPFTAGALLSFQVDTTNNADPGPTPDEFTFAILDSTLSELPTTGPASEFLSVDLGGAAPAVAAFDSAPGAQFAFAAPNVQNLTLPEPASYLLAALALIALRARRRAP
jgi:hypothetical protein